MSNFTSELFSFCLKIPLVFTFIVTYINSVKKIHNQVENSNMCKVLLFTCVIF